MSRTQTAPRNPHINADKPGSFQLLERLAKQGWIAKLRAMEWKVLNVMSAYADHFSVSSISVETISNATGINARNVRKTVKKLREAGYLIPTNRGGGRSLASRYKIYLPSNGIPLGIKTLSHKDPVSSQKTLSYLSTFEDTETLFRCDQVYDEYPVPVGPPSRENNIGALDPDECFQPSDDICAEEARDVVECQSADSGIERAEQTVVMGSEGNNLDADCASWPDDGPDANDALIECRPSDEEMAEYMDWLVQQRESSDVSEDLALVNSTVVTAPSMPDNGRQEVHEL